MLKLGVGKYFSIKILEKNKGLKLDENFLEFFGKFQF
jgi:hypothetical protein